MPTPAPLALDAPLTALPGVGDARAARLARLGLRRVRDLAVLRPRRLFEWPAPCTVAEAARRAGERVTVRGTLRRVRFSRIGGRRTVVRATVSDATGELDLLFFNQPWMRQALTGVSTVEAHGPVVDARGPALAAPRLASDDEPFPPPGTLVAEYPAPDGMSGAAVAKLVAHVVEACADELDEPLPADLLERLDLPPLPDAVRALHAPGRPADVERATRRLAFEPVLALPARLVERSRAAGGAARPARVTDALHAELVGRFPFRFTAAQERVAGELRRDLALRRPMRRLVQGDVGCGKTALAAYAALAVVEAGGQVAVMAPTEVLAAQHAYGLRPLLEDAGVASELLTSSVPAGERAALLERLARGDVDVLFGTHALFSDDVRFRRLDLVVIDEQHRFGVGQRARLASKGADAHLLLLTATPIPRTLALTLYGDLEVSTVDELPPGRGTTRTRWVRGDDRRRIPRFLAERLAAGEQAFWVVPRIGEADEDSGAPGAESRHARLGRRRDLADAGIELVHGRMPSAERAARLDRFRSGDAALLVATTVVEVGVDVPAATVMVVEDAHRLGLAQLHQLRGRVGRGGGDAWCLLLGDARAAERLRLLERTSDGFALAEEDLRRRGMGDLLGLRQSGENLEGLDDPERALELLVAARDLMRDPSLVRRYAADALDAAP